jgi:hypothetical protein
MIEERVTLGLAGVVIIPRSGNSTRGLALYRTSSSLDSRASPLNGLRIFEPTDYCFKLLHVLVECPILILILFEVLLKVVLQAAV